MSDGTASTFVGEEGGADVKSAWRLHPGRHTHYNEIDNGKPNRKVEQIPSNDLSVGIGACNSTP